MNYDQEIKLIAKKYNIVEENAVDIWALRNRLRILELRLIKAYSLGFKGYAEIYQDDIELYKFESDNAQLYQDKHTELLEIINNYLRKNNVN